MCFVHYSHGTDFLFFTGANGSRTRKFVVQTAFIPVISHLGSYKLAVSLARTAGPKPYFRPFYDTSTCS